MADFTLEPVKTESLLAAVERLHSLTIAFNAWVTRNGYQPIATAENLLTGVYFALRRLQSLLCQYPDMPTDAKGSGGSELGRPRVELVELLGAATNTLDAKLPIGMRIGDDLRPSWLSGKNQPTAFSAVAVEQLGLVMGTLKGKSARSKPARLKPASSTVTRTKPGRPKPARTKPVRSNQSPKPSVGLRVEFGL